MVSVCVRAPPRSWWVFMSVGSVPRPAAAAVHMWMETRPDFLLLRPIRAAVSPAPDEGTSPEVSAPPQMSRTRIWPRPGSGPSPDGAFILTEVAVAARTRRSLSKYFLTFQSHFQGNLIRTDKYYDANAFPSPDCNHLEPEFASFGRRHGTQAISAVSPPGGGAMLGGGLGVATLSGTLGRLQYVEQEVWLTADSL